MISIYDKKCTDFNNNGLVVLNDCKSCYIEEKLNDSYELILEYPIDERGKWQYLTDKNIIRADGQLFRIYHKVKNLTSITVNARHIFYDLMDNFLEEVKISGLSGLAALDSILSHTQYSHPFICAGDMGGSATADYVRKNIVEAIMSSDSSDSQQNSLLVNYGGELVRDNFTIGYWRHRGQDRGTTIRYGKNITGIEETLDMDNVVTRVMPIGKDGLLLDDKYIDSSLINNYPHPIVKSVEFSDDDTQDKLRASAQQYLQSGVDQPAINYEIDFIELTKTEEYKNYSVLESVYLGDTVTVKHERLGIDLKAEVIRVKKNVLTGRIEEVELGSFKHDLSGTFSSISNSYDNLQNHVNKINDNLQEQIDGKIETYFTDADPHTWPTSDNTAHNGDMWYKTDTRQLFRYNGSTDIWEEIQNQKAIDAYTVASTAQNTADGKRRVFLVLPIPPYDEGDLWTQGKSGDILVCQTAKGTGQPYSADDWVQASKYASGSYQVNIISTNGNIYKGENFSTTLIARVYHGPDDATDEIDANRFRWTRISDDTTGDSTWNTSHFGGSKQITVTQDDIKARATFQCTILDENLN